MTRRSGDVPAQLVRDRYPALLARARMLVRDPVAAQDLVRDALVATATGRSRPTSVPAAEHAVRRSLVTRLLDGQRERAAGERLAAQRAPDAADPSPTPAGTTGPVDEVEAALATLEPRERVCVVLRHLDGLSVGEVGEVLGLSEGLVRRSTADGVRTLCALLDVRTTDPDRERADGAVHPAGATPTVVTEGARDLTDVLRAAEAERAACSEGEPTVVAAASRALAAVRTARARRRVLVVAGAAAAVAVVVTGAVLWSQRGTPSSAAPEPGGAQVPGLSPLRQAEESDLRGAPDGSALALWVQPASDATPTPAAGAGAASTVARLLLVRPDGDVLDVGPAPEGMQMLTAWDRAAGTAEFWAEGSFGEATVVDLVSGQVVGTTPDSVDWAGDPSPDGAARAWTSDADLHVERDGVEVRYDLPATACWMVGWSDDTHVLVDCPRLDEATLRPAGLGATTLLMDTTTGAITDHRSVEAGEPSPAYPAHRLADGRLVASLAVRPDPTGEAPRTCPQRLVTLTGLDTAPFAEVPSDLLAVLPGVAPVPAGLLVSGTTNCEGTAGSAALWAVDGETGEVTDVLPSVETFDPTQAGLQSWVVGD
ncbi:sigma-70 family RNA polymerase sigma factor [Cellulomonas wangleii]|uniref:sigma-70 family RNA polymerase sigma factor n=1 Tax=Cellulomonas wangleii TaxID=2816956 RepID=UPI0022286B6C|nr:sigma-70 family RNA polymerase sigma factor [Cellulomonas wangleii]